MLQPKNSILALAAATAALFAATAARADAAFIQNVTLTSTYAVDSILLNERTPYPTYVLSHIAGPYAAPAGTSTITDENPSVLPVGTLLLLGTSDLGTAGSDRHLVLGVNSTYAASLVGKSFDSLFPRFNEDTIISTLDAIAADPGYDFYDPIFNLDSSLAARGAAFGSQDPFSLIAFSDGQSIGSGRAFIAGGAGAVPEPASWALLVVGLAGVGGALRLRRGPVAA